MWAAWTNSSIGFWRGTTCAAAFDAVWLVLQSVNTLLATVGPDFTGKQLMQEIMTDRFDGISGPVHVDQNGCRIINWTVMQYSFASNITKNSTSRRLGQDSLADICLQPRASELSLELIRQTRRRVEQLLMIWAAVRTGGTSGTFQDVIHEAWACWPIPGPMCKNVGNRFRGAGWYGLVDLFACFLAGSSLSSGWLT